MPSLLSNELGLWWCPTTLWTKVEGSQAMYHEGEFMFDEGSKKQGHFTRAGHQKTHFMKAIKKVAFQEGE